VQDGSEIHEAVTLLLAIDKMNAEYICCAPEGTQGRVINHATGKSVSEKRDIFVESARIARGNIRKITDMKVEDIDGLIFPGGFGAALNLCTFGLEGEKCSVREDVKNFIEAMHRAKKPIGAICIAPALIAKVLGKTGVEVTIGNDKETARKIEALGAKHINCAADGIVVDKKNKVVTTPAYMLADRISQVSKGIETLVAKILELAN